jgi:GNAT superfamily N-acetyltransferase
MLTIDALSVDDLPAALRLSTQAGWNQLDADWRRLLALWPGGCFAGRVNGYLIATSTIAMYGATLGWIGMVLVDESHRGRGCGGEILDAALRAARVAGIHTVGLDATDLGRPVYLKRGFQDIAGIDRWILTPDRRGNPPAVTPPISGENLHSCAADLDDAVALDLAITGVDRSHLLRHLCAEPGARLRVVRNSQSVTAFAIHRMGRTCTHLGPVIAETERAAAEVLDALLDHLPRLGGQPLLIDVPRGRLAHWLAARDFNCSRKLTRMQMGSAAPNLMQSRIFTACGFELG